MTEEELKHVIECSPHNLLDQPDQPGDLEDVGQYQYVRKQRVRGELGYSVDSSSSLIYKGKQYRQRQIQLVFYAVPGENLRNCCLFFVFEHILCSCALQRNCHLVGIMNILRTRSWVAPIALQEDQLPGPFDCLFGPHMGYSTASGLYSLNFPIHSSMFHVQ